MRYSIPLTALSILAGSLILISANVARADPQPGSGPIDTEQPLDHPAQPQPGQPPPVMAQPVAPAAADKPSDGTHPDALSIAIGAGYLLPTSLETPNVTSVRVRLPSGLTLEPLITLASSSTDTDPGVAGAPTSTDTKTEFGLTGLVRFPVVTHHKFDLELLGALSVDISKDNPEGDNNDTSKTTLALSWGLAVCYWITPHWQLSFTGTNPLISRVTTATEQATMIDMKTTTTSFGLIFDPTIAVMIHLYN